jgi:hypothetical protein
MDACVENKVFCLGREVMAAMIPGLAMCTPGTAETKVHIQVRWENFILFFGVIYESVAEPHRIDAAPRIRLLSPFVRLIYILQTFKNVCIWMRHRHRLQQRK